MSKAKRRREIANRRNARKSTGPRTPEGKARSSRNALKHGLLAAAVVLPDCAELETKEQFDTLLSDLTAELAPVGLIEEMLVEQIAVSYWRLRRALRKEAGEIAKQVDIYERFDMDGPIERECLPTLREVLLVLRYETALTRRIDKALANLERLQARRHASGSSRQHRPLAAGWPTIHGGESPASAAEKLPNEPNSPQPDDSRTVTPGFDSLGTKHLSPPLSFPP